MGIKSSAAALDAPAAAAATSSSLSATTGLKKRHHNSKSKASSSVSDYVNNPTDAITKIKREEQSARKKKHDNRKSIFNLLGGTGGMIDFHIFGRSPTWVDTSLPPGTTSQPEPKLDMTKVLEIVSGYSIVFSPNLIWFTISILIYVYAPYNIESYDGWSWHWYLNRTLLNTTIMLIYYGFWHATLYMMSFGAKRPFAQGRNYRFSKTVHNIWYCWLGVLQWTAWEMIMVHLYATGRIGYQKDSEIFRSPWEFIKFFLAAICVPVYREVHFFFAHRFIHLRCLYKYIHQLHHRNSDVEPFSGLCMTPVEHLYYISSIAPSLYWHASPFQFLWNGTHLMLSPGASHSGWEDHWHSDQFHCAHHRYFECNYGTPGFPLDSWFGTFRETMAPQTTKYKGDAVECMTHEGSAVIMARPDSKSTLWGLPSWDQMVYYVLTAIGLPVFVMWHLQNVRVSDAPKLHPISPALAAFLVSVGPLMLATILSIITANPPITSWAKLRYAMLYPQHNEPLIGKFSIGLVMGIVLAIVPTYHFFHGLFVQDPNQTAYKQIWT